jgi:hypothetical protein
MREVEKRREGAHATGDGTGEPDRDPGRHVETANVCSSFGVRCPSRGKGIISGL